MRYTPKAELDRRIAGLQSLLTQEGLDGALIVHNADLFYLSGTMQQAHLFVPAAGPPLLTVRRSFERARQESALAGVVPLTSLRQLPALLADHGYAGLERLGMELDVLPTNLYFLYDELFPAAVVDVSPLVRQIRAVKSEYEIELIRQAALMLDVVAGSVGQCLEEGITEIEFAGRLEAVARREGHPGLVRVRRFNQETFYGHIVSGPSGAVPTYMNAAIGGWGATPAFPQGAGLRCIGRGEPVMVDYGGCVEGYIADQTRIFSLGPLSDELMAAYQAMRAIHDEVAALARPGVACGELYELAVRRAEEMGYGPYFGGYGETQVAFVGHCLGLELDEQPVLAKGVTIPLEEGMVFALEPKAVFPGRGVVGMENTFAVRAGGVEKLTVSDEDVVVV